MKTLLTLCLIIIVQSSRSQTTNPFPYCAHEYDDGASPLSHYISSFTLGSFTNVSGPVQQPFPHYIFYNNLSPGPFLQNNTYAFSIEIDTLGVSRQINMFADWDSDGMLEAAEMIYSQTASGNVSSINGAVTIPIMAGGTGTIRLRVFLAEDTSGIGLYSACTTTADWGETEDYDIQVASTVSMNDHASDNYLIYPNPTSGLIRFESDMQTSTIEIFDLAAKKVAAYEIGADAIPINIASLESGSYLFIARSSSGEERRKIIFKN